MAEIPCLACDKALKLPQFVNTDNYDGQVVCIKCKALLHIKLVKNEVLKYNIVERLRQGEPRKVILEVEHVDIGKKPS